MYGLPELVEGECNAILEIADDYGDNSATIRCQLEPEHEGPHKEVFQRDGMPVVITWHGDERKVCSKCKAKVFDWNIDTSGGKFKAKCPECDAVQ